MKAVKLFALSIFSFTLLIGCGGKEEKKKEGFSYEKKTNKTETETKTDNNVASIVISGDDMMKFDKSEIKVKAGQKVKITLRHKGKMAINIMGHNLVILKQGVNVAAFGNKAATSKATDYIPADFKDDIIAHTKLIGGGQTTTIEFDAPEPGTYDFLCSFPGHYAIMKGKFIVE
ncbi:azurin [Flavivirga aquimarina]|uniref:Azurin n=1 Tax=Flavivirga aquimarina TaxID=2027862 RepID=A0ABT8WGZ3_9FLAO|nr:azurin [Flavivirga aquimarina]MDO5972352.1 azurin [Flavivirga aquimarina]